MVDPATLPASVLTAATVDPAAGSGAPPNFGRQIVPHVHTAAGRYGVASHAYLNIDEATRDSRTNAERMRSDCGIMECLEQRQRAVALLPWHLEPEDDKDQRQVDHAALMTAILEKTPRFTELRRVNLEALWYGRYATAQQFGPQRVKGQWRTVVRRWEPRHGDKLVFRFDDGDLQHEPGQVGLRVSTAYSDRRREPGQPSRIQPTEQGLVYWLDRAERQTIIVHKHMVEDGPYEDPRSAGRIHGVGIRDRIYWTWYAMVECLQRVMEYLDRAAFGIEIWPFPAGNPVAEEATRKAATGVSGGGRTVILAPVPQGEDAELYQPRLIEPGLGGVQTTIDMIRTFFCHKIKRYILGQVLSSESEGGGLGGSGVADAHMATLADILSYDARNLEETLTDDLLRPLESWNFPGIDFGLRLKIDTESDNVRERLDALRASWDMGLNIKADELYRIVGTARPDGDDEILSNPQVAGAAAAAGGIPGPGQAGQPMTLSPSSLESFHRSFVDSMLQARGMAA